MGMLLSKRLRHFHQRVRCTGLCVKQLSQLASHHRQVPLVFFSDANFKLLRNQFVSSATGKGFQLWESYVDDLAVNPHRAGGGRNVYEFKTRLVLESLDRVVPGDFLVISDVDVRFIDDAVVSCINESVLDLDACFQREFVDLGVNIGFMALRRTAPCMAFWQEVERLVLLNGVFDQRIVNDLLYGGFADHLGMRWGRFPVSVWASSQAFSENGAPPKDILLHHANWVLREQHTWSSTSQGASHPEPKFMQLLALGDVLADSQDDQARRNFARCFAADPQLAKYHRRSVGDLRRGPEWVTLAKGHPARLGAVREGRNRFIAPALHDD